MPSALTEVLETLGLDGRLFAAQLLNVFLVFFVLWRWVFRPLETIMKERERRLKEGRDIIERAAHEREQLKREHDRQRKAWQREADSLELAARERANAQAKTVIDEAQARAEALIASAKAQAAHEHQVMMENAQEQLAQAALAITETLIGKGTAKRQQELLDEALKALKKGDV